MSKRKVAIIGLGRVGTEFLDVMIHHHERVKVVAVAELKETDGKAKALADGIRVMSLDEIVHQGEHIDIIFDLTANVEVRNELRAGLDETGNHHTVIAPETVAILISEMFSGKSIPNVHPFKGNY